MAKTEEKNKEEISFEENKIIISSINETIKDNEVMNMILERVISEMNNLQNKIWQNPH